MAGTRSLYIVTTRVVRRTAVASEASATGTRRATPTSSHRITGKTRSHFEGGKYNVYSDRKSIARRAAATASADSCRRCEQHGLRARLAPRTQDHLQVEF